MNTTWSKPFHKIEHLQGLKRGFQVTVVDHELFADCKVWVPGTGFTAVTTKHASVTEAKMYGEAQARQLGAIEGEAK